MKNSGLNLHFLFIAGLVMFGSFGVFADDDTRELKRLSDTKSADETIENGDEPAEPETLDEKPSIRSKNKKASALSFDIETWDYTPFWRRGPLCRIVRVARKSSHKNPPATAPASTNTEDSVTDSVTDSATEIVEIESVDLRGAMPVLSDFGASYSTRAVSLTGTVSGDYTGNSDWNQQTAFVNGDESGENPGSVVIDGGYKWYSDPVNTAATVTNNKNSSIVIGSSNSENGNGTWNSTGTVTNLGDRIQIYGGSSWTSSEGVATSGTGKILIETGATWTINSGNVVFASDENRAFWNNGTTTFNGGSLTTNFASSAKDDSGIITQSGEENYGKIVFNNAGTVDSASWNSEGNFINHGTLEANAGVYIKNTGAFFENEATGTLTFKSMTFADAAQDTTFKNLGKATFNDSTLAFNGSFTNGSIDKIGAGTAILKIENNTSLSAHAFWNLDSATIDNSSITIFATNGSTFLNRATLTLQNGSVLDSSKSSQSVNTKAISIQSGSRWNAAAGTSLVACAYDPNTNTQLLGTLDVNGKFAIAALKFGNNYSVSLSRDAIIAASGGIISVSEDGVSSYGNTTGATIITSISDDSRGTALFTAGSNTKVTLSSGVSLVLTGTSASVEAAMKEGASKGKTFVEAMQLVAGTAAEWSTTDSKDLAWASEYAGLPSGVTLKGQFESVWFGGISYLGVLGSDGKIYIAVPEPSFFGLFAGIVAIALAGTRRRRK